MAKGQYIGVNNIARKVKQPYIGVGNVARKVKKSYIGVGNVARECFSGGTPVGTLEVGSSVWMNVNGVSTEFLVVHQGIPNANKYDNSCDGTWLLAKKVYTELAWNTNSGTYNSYDKSSIHSYLNNTFLNFLNANIKNVVKEVKIPYKKRQADGTFTIYTNTSDLITSVFLLSHAEVDNSMNNAYTEGSVLEYFNSADVSKRIDSSYAYGWYLRSPNTESAAHAYVVLKDGTISSNGGVSAARGIRPALILSNEALIDEKFNVIG